MEREVTHSCGHSQRHHIVAGFFAADSDARVRKLARMKCTTCFEAGRAAKAALNADANSATLGDIVLPALVGTEKQVAWATTLRLESLSALHRVDRTATPTFAVVTDARWWINNRGIDLRTVPPPTSL